MFELMKIVGLSAVLSAGLVTASEVQTQAGTGAAGAKIYNDRVPQGEPVQARITKAVYAAERDQAAGAQTVAESKGDLLGKAQKGACSSQAWPYVAPECVGKADGPARAGVRLITVEQRQGENTSVLVRIPASELAQR